MNGIQNGVKSAAPQRSILQTATAALIAGLIIAGVSWAVFSTLGTFDNGDSGRGSEPTVETSGGSCLPGTDECVSSCATGSGAVCKPNTPFERTCDCTHPWNQGGGPFD